MPSYLFAIWFYLAPETITNFQQFISIENGLGLGFRENLLFLIFISTFLLPSSIIYYFYKIKLIPNLQLENLADRKLPFFITSLIYFIFTLLIAQKIPDIKEISIGLFSITISIFLVFLISFYWQISAHAVGISGVVGAILILIIKKDAIQLFFLFNILLILTGLIASARLRLNAHTPSQIIGGLILGLSVSLLFSIIYL
jgi:membrane-associated phospholipid phosphatase